MAERPMREMLEEALERLERMEQSIRILSGVGAYTAQGVRETASEQAATLAAIQAELVSTRQALAALTAGPSLLGRIVDRVTEDQLSRRMALTALTVVISAIAVLLVSVSLAIGGDLLPTTISILLGRGGAQPIQQVISPPPSEQP